MANSYAEQLIELARLYFTACLANSSKPDLTAFNVELETTPLENRRYLLSFLDDMMQAVNVKCCPHTSSQWSEVKDDRQKCFACHYVRYRYWVKDEDDSMMNAGHWEWGRWRPQFSPTFHAPA